jgi:hypothetical protein
VHSHAHGCDVAFPRAVSMPDLPSRIYRPVRSGSGRQIRARRTPSRGRHRGGAGVMAAGPSFACGGRVRMMVRVLRAARALRRYTPYVAGEAFHTGCGPFAQAAHEKRRHIAQRARRDIARYCRKFRTTVPFLFAGAGAQSVTSSPHASVGVRRPSWKPGHVRGRNCPIAERIQRI